MFDYVQKEKELITTINCNLNDLKLFLVGNTPKEKDVCEMKASECLRDDIIENLNGLDYTLKTITEIADAIKGGRK